MGDTLDLTNVFQEYMGALYLGDVKLGSSSLTFKNRTSNKHLTINNDDVEAVDITYLANQPGLRLLTKNGDLYRFGGFSDSMANKAKAFIATKWRRDVGTQEISIKGWNFGEANIVGKNIQFTVNDTTAFEIPLSNVSNCSASKSEAVVELHVNDDCPVGLLEMRLHIPMVDGAEEDEVPAEDFRNEVMQFAGIAAETEQPIVMLSQMPLVTPRGRYDIKIFPTFLSFHGKTYDYKIPSKTVTRLFMLPHKDNRRTYFVMHVNPAIRQGQTRYAYLVFEFNNEERGDVELTLTTEQLRSQYESKIEKQMTGLLHQIVAKLFRVFVGIKVTVPANFNDKSEPITCSHRQSHGFFYLMDKGFMYVPKPPIYIKFEDIANIDFARSDVSTKTFDLEFSTKGGQSYTFSSLAKDDFDPLLAFCKEKNLPVKDVKKLAKAAVTDFGKNNDIDAGYKQRLKADAASSDEDDDEDSSDDEDYDLDADERRRKKKEAEDSSAGSGSEPDEEYNTPEEDSDIEPKPKKPKSDKKKDKDRSEKSEKKEKSSRTPKKGKKDKDPNAPKRGQTAFFIWLNENRPKFAKGGASVTEVTKEAGRVWKGMSESDKAPWEAKSKKDKERYEREMEKYKASGGGASSSKSSKKGASSAASTPRKSANSSMNTSKSSPTKAAKSKEYLSTSEDDSSSDDGKKKGKKPTGSSDKKAGASGDKKKAKEPTPESSDVSSDESDD
uniref:FACT complex subunit SSRP1 n=1 Tax=Panagrellus redivivus TaxID=6233 RepID=A0A7E4ZSP2_PANRE